MSYLCLCGCQQLRKRDLVTRRWIARVCLPFNAESRDLQRPSFTQNSEVDDTPAQPMRQYVLVPPLSITLQDRNTASVHRQLLQNHSSSCDFAALLQRISSFRVEWKAEYRIRGMLVAAFQIKEELSVVGNVSAFGTVEKEGRCC